MMDNLSSHKGSRVRELIEERGCELIYPVALLSRSQTDRESLLEGQGILSGGSTQPGGSHRGGGHSAICSQSP